MNLEEIKRKQDLAMDKLISAIEDKNLDLIQEYRKDFGHWLLKEHNLGKTCPIVKVSSMCNTHFVYVTGIEDLQQALDIVVKQFPELDQDSIIIQKLIPMKLY